MVSLLACHSCTQGSEQITGFMSFGRVRFYLSDAIMSQRLQSPFSQREEYALNVTCLQMSNVALRHR